MEDLEARLREAQARLAEATTNLHNQTTALAMRQAEDALYQKDALDLWHGAERAWASFAYYSGQVANAKHALWQAQLKARRTTRLEGTS